MQRTLPLTALAAALTLAACNQAPQTTDNAAVNVDEAADINGTAFDDEAPVIEDVDEDSASAVAVVAVPQAPRGATETEPLVEASEIEDEIRAGRGIERVRYGEGWAWMRDGRIIRTADRDGRNSAYFRRGEDRPFFVQRGGESYAYKGDRPVRQFDRDGRGRAPDADRTRQAEEAARQASAQRQQAEQARDRAGRRSRGPGQPEASPSPTATADRPDRRGAGGRDRNPEATPTASPSPGATPRWREPERRPERQP